MENDIIWTPENKRIIKRYAKHRKTDIISLAKQGSTQEIIKQHRQEMDMHTYLKTPSAVNVKFRDSKPYTFTNVKQIDWIYDWSEPESDIFLVIFTVKYGSKITIYKIYRNVSTLSIEGVGQLFPVTSKSIINKNPLHYVSKSTHCTNERCIRTKYPQLKPSTGPVKMNHV